MTCAHEESAVFDSRPVNLSGHTSTRRRRRCAACGHRWTTYEITNEAFLAAIAQHVADVHVAINDALCRMSDRTISGYVESAEEDRRRLREAYHARRGAREE